MGCSASSRRRKPKASFDTQVTAISGIEDDLEDIDYAVGFNSKASEENCWGGNSAGRDESDEFRVMRVSSLSGQVTLYVAGGKHKKPTQYAADRLCPMAEDQPPMCQRCPFCPGNELKTPPSILAFDENGAELPMEQGVSWRVRVFPNIFPMLICPLSFYGQAHKEALGSIPHSVVAAGKHSNHKVGRDADNPTYHQVDAIGASEVIVESPVHNALLALQEPAQITLLLKALVSRGQKLAQQPWSKQLLFFKQYGPLSGGSLVHPHTQVVSLPVLPPPLISRLEYIMYIRSSHGRCATCLACVDPFVRKFAPDQNGLNTPGKKNGNPNIQGPNGMKSPNSLTPLGKIGPVMTQAVTPETSPRSPRPEDPAGSRLVHITEYFVVSVPYASSSQYSMTIAPRRHSAHFLEATTEELDDLAQILALLAQALYYGLSDPSYNIFIRTAPSVATLKVRGREVGQDEISRCYHWILEFRPRFPADLGGFEIASGVRVVTGLPEDHAADLRGWVKERLEAGVKPVPPNNLDYQRLDFSRMSSKASRTSEFDRARSPIIASSRRSSSKVSKNAWEDASGRKSCPA